ncbi:MAG: efflux RND transporter periplasmic adaptor subunit [Phascolarctobacterium sp.]|nr:efflux RND transporter periplasmic adaptor subunit [Phascolarctobacterium sp.]
MKKIIILIIVLALAAGGFYYYKNQTKEDVDKAILYGNVEIRQTNLSFQVSGKIKELLVEEGDAVKAGQVVAVLDSSDYEMALRQAQAQVKQLEAQEAAAQDKYNRYSALARQNVISQLEFENITHNLTANIAGVEAAKEAAKIAENKLAYTKLIAPEEGTIISRAQEPGATVSASQTIYTLSKMKPMWIRAYISEKQLGNVYPDMSATVLTDTVDPKTGEKRSYKGRVGYISPTAEFTPKTVQTEELRTDLVYQIRVYVDEPDKFLRQGMPTTIKLDFKEEQNKEQEKQSK